MFFIRIGLSLVFVALAGLPTEGQAAPPAQSAAPIVKPAPFSDQLRKTIAFLRVDYLNLDETKPENRAREIRGTAFIVGYPDVRLGKTGGFTYLVTNRHMVVPGIEEGHSYPVTKYCVRLNVFKQLPPNPCGNAPGDGLLDPSAHWFLPADPSVDLAVIPFGGIQGIADYVSIPIDAILTKDGIAAHQIAPGDQVIFAGYFYQFPGDQRIQPIVRQGVLAMMPDELVPTPLQKKAGHVYFVDAHAFHGNSGSPIFVNTGGVRGNSMGGVSYQLLGIVSGYYPESEDGFSVPAAQVLTGQVHDNSGITVVVPADELKALLDIPELQMLREKLVADFLNKK
jgi:hypothetical protein